MQQRIINPTDGIYPATEDYVHALEISGGKRQLFVSGTMGLAQDGTPPESLDEQLDLVWSNIRTILSAADMSMDNIIRVTSYLTDPAHAEKNQNARLKTLGERRIPTTAIVVQTLETRWLVEIEIIAMA